MQADEVVSEGDNRGYQHASRTIVRLPSGRRLLQRSAVALEEPDGSVVLPGCYCVIQKCFGPPDRVYSLLYGELGAHGRRFGSPLVTEVSRL